MANDTPAVTGDLLHGAGLVVVDGAGNYYAIPSADLARFRVSDDQQALLEEASADQDVSGYLGLDPRFLPATRFDGGIWGKVIAFPAQDAARTPLIDYHGGNPER